MYLDIKFNFDFFIGNIKSIFLRFKKKYIFVGRVYLEKTNMLECC